MQMSEGDNNDGMAVIDVTDPNSPSYCFISSGRRRRVTVKNYKGGYDNEKDPEVSFTGISVIPIQSLAEVWPTEFTAKSENDPPLEPVLSLTQKVPLLADLMLEPALDKSLRNNDQEELLRLLLPHKIDKIREILRSGGQNPMLDGSVFLLSNILKDTKDQKVLHLSGLHLTTQQVLSLIPVDAEIEVINLSHNHAAEIDIIEQLLARYRSLRRLVLLDTCIPEGDVVALLKAKPSLLRLGSYKHFSSIRS
ncbi:hypothetical protein BDN72DRAFT_460787 [Pluteus cervinus]|uniref:Uncharacterized protein n=1 Tax=Pluteus cervinus TaxID=181527 RepID=A0ACD3A7A4_9AGAR|nr:hypothetical protein BDN72DRAFT_460787 [Pluteus cervinus]